MPYHHLTELEREACVRLRHEGLSDRAIALRLNRHHSTVSREHCRNRCPDGKYRREKAQRRALSRRRRSRRNQRISPSTWALVTLFLTRYQWSPEQISGYLWKEKVALISHERIYQYIWADCHRGGQLYRELRGRRKHRRNRSRVNDYRGRLPGKRSIEERPAVANDRLEIGHWEADTVMGPIGTKHCFITVVDRKTGYLQIAKVDDRTAEAIADAMIALFRRSRLPVRSITVDNGTEFHAYKKIEIALNATFYFCHPYHSWERGTNENTNGLIRQYAPKKFNLSHFTQESCDNITSKLNHRPRKRLNYQSPATCFFACA